MEIEWEREMEIEREMKIEWEREMEIERQRRMKEQQISFFVAVLFPFLVPSLFVAILFPFLV
jgi:leucyl-tRNA synthetase